MLVKHNFKVGRVVFNTKKTPETLASGALQALATAIDQTPSG
jgi:hypothetical protein